MSEAYEQQVERFARLMGVDKHWLYAALQVYEERSRDYTYTERNDAGRQVLWHRGHTTIGWEPGGFMSSILLAFGRADMLNRYRLAQAYPAIFDALVACDRGGVEGVLEWIGQP